MEIKEQVQISETIDKIKEQIGIEENNKMWKNGLKYELKMVKAAVITAPSNSTEQLDIAKSFLNGLVTSISNMTIDVELLTAIFDGVVYLYKQNKKKKLRAKYEVHYFFE